MFVVTMENAGGELDRKEAGTAEAAMEALLQMIEEAGCVYGGDCFRVSEE